MKKAIELLLLKLSVAKISPSLLRDYLLSLPNEDSINPESAIDYLGEDVDIAPVLRMDISSLYTHLKKKGVSIIPILSEDYPENLKNIPKPPPIIYVRGEIVPEDRRAIGIIGTRRPTEYGRSIALKFSRELAEAGFTIISGLAMGIDTAAHRGALEGGGRTIGVIGCGIDRVYPSSNKRLAEIISDGNGAIISDFPPGTPPMKYNFPLRNRIISGLSLTIVAVQAASRSGVFSTVNWALEYGRDVFAVPGNINIKQSQGTNKLIKDGAIPITKTEDIFDYMGLRFEEKKEDKPLNLPDDEKLVYDTLGDNPLTLDRICEITRMAPQQVNAILLLLELKGLIREVGGRRFVKEAR